MDLSFLETDYTIPAEFLWLFFALSDRSWINEEGTDLTEEGFPDVISSLYNTWIDGNNLPSEHSLIS